MQTAEEVKAFKKHLIYTILRIIVTRGGASFKIFEQDLQIRLPWKGDVEQMCSISYSNRTPSLYLERILDSE